MADRTPNQDAVEFGQHLTALYEAAGEPGFGVMHRTILLNTGGKVSVSDQQLRGVMEGRRYAS